MSSDPVSSSGLKKVVPVLRGQDDYDTWQRKAKAGLMALNLWKSVNPAVPIPANYQAHQKWEEKNQQAYGELFLVVSDEIQGMLEDLPQQDSGRAIWAFLALKYAAKNTPSSRQSLRTTFYNLSHDPTLPVDNFISSVTRVAAKLKTIGHPYPDDEISDKIIVSLDPLFTPIRTVLSNETSQRDLNGICQALIEWEKTELKQKTSPLSQEIALAATYHRSRGQGGRNFDWGNTKGRADACGRCGLFGHPATTCIHDMPEDVKRRILSRGRSQSSYFAQDTSDVSETFAGVTIDATESGSDADRDALHALTTQYGQPVRIVQHIHSSSSPNQVHSDTVEHSMSTLVDDHSQQLSGSLPAQPILTPCVDGVGLSEVEIQAYVARKFEGGNTDPDTWSLGSSGYMSN